jgi:preprotein translocase subunit YajC
MSKFSRNQQGSILSFISIAIVLVLLIAGSIYFVNQRAETARKNEASKLAEQTPQDSGTVSKEPINESSTSEPAAATNSSVAVSNNLPETGMGSDIMSTLALAAITASFSYFVISRRNLKLSL